MKKIINFVKNNLLTVVLILLILSLFSNLNSCNTNKEKDVKIKKIEKELVVAEKKGYFKAKEELKPIVKYDTIRDTVKGKTIYVLKENPVNQDLLNKYNELSDSLKLLAYKDAITEREYEETFENDTIKAVVNAKVTGNLNSLSLDYFIKEFSVKYFETEKTIYERPKFILYSGLGFSNSIENLHSPVFDASLGFMNSKGTHFEISINTRKELGLSLKKNLFTKY